MTSEEALGKHRQQAAGKISEVALLLRKNIMNAEKTQLPESLTLKDILHFLKVYHCTNVSLFFKYLIA